MIFWFLYYFILFGICILFIKFIKNKFLRFFFTPIIFGLFGSIWFKSPGSLDLAPIFSILFLEASIIDSNGYFRLIRPMISFILFLQGMSLLYYFFNKNKKTKNSS